MQRNSSHETFITFRLSDVMRYLYQILKEEFGRQTINSTEVPAIILDNLRSGYGRRPYQIEAFQYFILCYNRTFEGKPQKPLHLLFNMATGSGKTLIMAGLILYLYERGYRNFLFFVDRDNIIKKTKNNFINPRASKYLFNDKLVIDRREIFIKEVENFEEADAESINIKFTTVTQLHIDIKTTKENSITIEDFENKKIVLIADEAHHLSSATQNNRSIFNTWEGTVLKILKANFDNILLEFTATLDYEIPEIVQKYKNKVIYKYDLAQFYSDKYSKEIMLICSYYEERSRIAQALILNLYRQELAAAYNINLKPVILFKAKRTIVESEKNKNKFHELIEGFSDDLVNHILQTSTVPIVQKAFKFFKERNLSNNEIAKRIKFNFREENCLSANACEDLEKNQIILNTLEDNDNPIRAIFAVKKLDEGWDVLNLFDIVRLYEGRDSQNGNPGRVTNSEAQLIGRGARYFPFIIEKGQNPYVRKFDNDVSNDLKVLEELYYHTKEDSHYISELKRALIETGIYKNDLETKELKIKESFKQTKLYKYGWVLFNKKIERTYDKVNSFSDFGVTKKNFKHVLSSGSGRISEVFSEQEENESTNTVSERDISIARIPPHIIRFALSHNSFYHYDNLIKFFPNIDSMSTFISSTNYLKRLEITFCGTQSRLVRITNQDYLVAIQGLLEEIEIEIKTISTEYEGSGYVKGSIHKVFKDKKIKVQRNSERANGQFEVVSEPKWYVYNANYGTIEEKNFVKMFARRFKHLDDKYIDIYLIRNERELKIFDKSGRAFEPDFVLFCKEKNGEEQIYQIFIEPKGAHLQEADRWKEEFLANIRQEKKTIKINTDKYLITGLPFYDSENENDFKRALAKVLNTDEQISQQ